MCSMTKITLSTAIVLSTAFSASATTKPRLIHVHRSAIHDVILDLSAPSDGPARDYLTDPIMVPEPGSRRAAGQ
jgi:hypothetical protein